MRSFIAALLVMFFARAAFSGECEKPRQTRQGAVQGRAEAAACVWKGIPYAAAPVGGLRFRPPEPPAPHPGTLFADKFGSMCLQPGMETHLKLGFHRILGGEDCLFLNIWSPMKSGSFPVMVWIHGGDLLQGEAGTEMYWGDRLAAEADVVVVSINYRLGPLGFLYHDSLAAEDPEGGAGNYGLLDQAAALAWVRGNIAAFSGDPDNVTLFGQSAGAWSVCALLASPKAAGLFQRAIIMSGGCESARTREEGSAYGDEFAKRMGCEGASAAKCLREKSGREIIAALGRDWELMMGHFMPHADGVSLKAIPLAVLTSGDFNRVPVMAGMTRDEFKLFSSELPFSSRVKESEMEAAAEQYLNAQLSPGLTAFYPPSSYPRPFDALVAAFGDAFLACPMHRAALAASQHTPTFYYRFDYDGILFSERIGASHGLDLPFIFDSFDRSPANLLYTRAQTRRARPLTETMMNYFSAFARTGNPNSSGLPQWPPTSPGNQLQIIFDEPVRVAPSDLDAKCEWWEKQPIVVH